MGLPDQGDMTSFCNRPHILYYQNSFDPDNRNTYEMVIRKTNPHYKTFCTYITLGCDFWIYLLFLKC